MEIYRILFLMLCSKCLTNVHAGIRIPNMLRECYENNAEDIHLPLNLRVLVDIIGKVERDSRTKMDLRMLSSSLLRRFKFDGVEYIENLDTTDGVLPYSGTGSQRTKHVLIEEMVPGNSEVFPSDTLDPIERCTLHRAISNSVAKHGTSVTCRQVERTERITGRTVVADGWDCPREQGVIYTQHGGTVALGAVIGAIAAGLQRQSVTLKELLAAENSTDTSMERSTLNEEEAEFVLPTKQTILRRSTWRSSLDSSSVRLDNVWLTTIAGDLAEMVVYQGPVVGPRMTLGETGFWNNTMRPHAYYLIRGKRENFDATRAEIIGDIDGLVVANKLQAWLSNFQSMRLSQLLYMYYSDHGVTINGGNVRACDRGREFSHVAPRTILEEQTRLVSQVLAYRRSVAYVSEEAFRRMVGYAVDKFFAYAKEHLLTELHCRDQRYRPRVEAVVVFDGAWSREYTMDFMAALIDDLDVSVYDSKIGIVHGSTGEWLLNVTNSPSSAYRALSDFTHVPWPTAFNFTRSLQTAFDHLENTWEENRKNRVIGGIGQAIVFLIPLVYLSEDEQRSALSLVKDIKLRHPDVHFLYCTSEQNAYLLKPFILSAEDRLLRGSNINDIVRHLETVPRVLRPTSGSSIDADFGRKDQVEGYVHPSETITYRLHPRSRIGTKKVTVTVHGFGYGAMKVCSWTRHKTNGPEEELYCKHLDNHGDVSLTDYSACGKTSGCPDIFYRIQDVRSLQKCAEIDCKTPDHVRYIIRVEKTGLKNSAHQNTLSPFAYSTFALYLAAYLANLINSFLLVL